MKGKGNIGFIVLALAAGLHPFCLSQESFPQMDNIIPPSPTAASLGRYADIPVSLYTGTPEITIPLWEARGRRLGLTVSLSYHASGMKVDEIAGWVGLGWSLNAGGVITRSVRGIADDHPYGYYTLNGNPLPALGNDYSDFGPWQPPGADDLERDVYLQEVADGRADAEPDIFFFNFNGRSGKIVFNVNREPVVIPHQNLVISPLADPAGKIGTWEITDEGGNIYLFGTPDATEISTPLTEAGSREMPFCSSWYLKEIRSPNRDDIITFRYIDYSVSQRHALPQRKTGNTDPRWEDLRRYSETEIQGKYLREIDYSGGIILFDTASFGIYPGGRITGMNRMTITDQYTGEVVRSFRFEYSFYETVSFGPWHDYLPPSLRLRLDRITEYSGSGEEHNPPYMFFYHAIPLPPRGTYSQDHWGYYNGAANEYFIPESTIRNFSHFDSIPPVNDSPQGVNFEKLVRVNLNLPQVSENIWRQTGADREPDPEFVRAGLISRIVYPTGASTLFEFEPHEFGYFSGPRKSQMSSVGAAYESFLSHPAEETVYLTIPYDQKIRIVPLFYIIKGSRKDGPGDDDEDPSDHSGIFLVSEPETDGGLDTLYSLSFSEHKNTFAGWDGTYELWIREGRYHLGALAHEKGDYTGVILYSNPVSPYDLTLPVYSCDYKDTIVMAGEYIYIDDSSYYCSEIAEISGEDENLAEIEVLFRSSVHPNQVSSFGLEILHTRVRIYEYGKPDNILYEALYYDDDRIKWDQNAGKWYFSESFSKFIKPGRYIVEFIPRIKSEAGYIKVKWNKASRIHNYRIAGGVRIKRIIDIDNDTDTIGLREFSYRITDNGFIRSSGVLHSWPVYYDLPDRTYYLNDEGIPSRISYIPLTLYSSGKNVLGSTQGSHIGYRQVEVSNPLSGKTVHRFTSAWEYPDISTNHFPFANATSYDWKRGLPTETRKYSTTGILREEETFSYNPAEDSLNLTYIPALKVARKSPELEFAIVYEKYLQITAWNYPRSKTLVRYDTSGLDPFIIRESYHYDPGHLQLKTLTKTDSDGSLVTERYFYPGECEEQEADVTSQLIKRHMINPILKKEVSRDSLVISGTRTLYGLFNGNLLLPARIQHLEGSEYVLKTTFDRYDDSGNLLQYHHEGDVMRSLNWGYGKNYPVAEVVNASYRENVDGYPANARITRYAYRPLFGISSVTAPDGISTHYEYDRLGRLTTIRDHDTNLVRHIDYHFKPYPGDTTRTEWHPVNLTESVPPDNILADYPIMPANCSVTLTLRGGLLGTNASWEWYAGSCGGEIAGSGPILTVSPSAQTTYYVRAVGDANITPCRSITIDVTPVSFRPVPGTLAFGREGTTGFPEIVLTNYSGCDPWEVAELPAWLSLTGRDDDSFTVGCAPNTAPDARHGDIVLAGNGQTYPYPVFQEGSGQVTLQVDYSPTTVLPGDSVTFTATVSGGTQPYRYLWETRPYGQVTWDTLRDHTGNEFSDTFLTGPVTASFEVRCTVFTGGETLLTTLPIVVAE